MKPRHIARLAWRWLHTTTAPQATPAGFRTRMGTVVLVLVAVGAAAPHLVRRANLMPYLPVLPHVVTGLVALSGACVLLMGTLSLDRQRRPPVMELLPASEASTALVQRVHQLALAVCVPVLVGPAAVAALGRAQVAPGRAVVAVLVAHLVGVGVVLAAVRLGDEAARWCRWGTMAPVVTVALVFGWICVGPRAMAGNRLAQAVALWPHVAAWLTGAPAWPVVAVTAAGAALVLVGTMALANEPARVRPVRPVRVPGGLATQPVMLLVRAVRTPHIRSMLVGALATALAIGWLGHRGVLAGAESTLVYLLAVMTATLAVQLRGLDGSTPREFHFGASQLRTTAAPFVVAALGGLSLVLGFALAGVLPASGHLRAMAAGATVTAAALGVLVAVLLRPAPGNTNGELLATAAAMAALAALFQLAPALDDSMAGAALWNALCLLLSVPIVLLANHLAGHNWRREVLSGTELTAG